MTEEWRTVPGFPSYEVSSLGQVRASRRQGSAGGTLAQSVSRDGYRRVYLYNADHKRFTVRVHAAVLLAFVGPRPSPETHIRHLNGDPGNNGLENLRYGTASENQQDAIAHGTHPQASKTHCLRGHEYSPENTYTPPGSRHRWCRACFRYRAAIYAAKKAS